MRLLFLAFLTAACLPAHAEDAAPAPVPGFEALRAGKVNMHAGPGQQYPVIWTYQRKNLPVRILASYDVWRKVSDPEGTVGWVETTMLSEKRTLIVARSRRTLRHDPQDTAAAVALADPGAIAHAVACTGGWCHVKFDDFEGWMKEGELWGADPNESFDTKR